MFVIIRTDQSGGYLTPSGSDKAYTSKLEDARKFETRTEAESEQLGNETVRNMYYIDNTW